MLSKRTVLFVCGICLIAIASFWSISSFFHVRRTPPKVFSEVDSSLIEDWMTIRYISSQYRIPPWEIGRLLGVTEKEDHKKSILQIAKEKQKDPQEFLLEVRRVVRELQEQRPK